MLARATDDPWDVEAVIGELEFADPGERPANVAAFDDVPFDEDGDKVLATAAGSEQTGLNWVRREAGKRLLRVRELIGKN